MKILLEDRTYEGIVKDFGTLGFRSLLDLEDNEAFAIVECYKNDRPIDFECDDMFENINDDLEWAWMEGVKNKM